MEKHKEILKQFIIEFLQPAQFLKGQNQSLTYIHNILSRVSTNHLGFAKRHIVEKEVLLGLFENLGYATKIGKEKPKGWKGSPSEVVDATYVGLKGADVLVLRHSCARLMPNMPLAKLNEIELWENRINAFKSAYGIK